MGDVLYIPRSARTKKHQIDGRMVAVPRAGGRMPVLAEIFVRLQAAKRDITIVIGTIDLLLANAGEVVELLPAGAGKSQLQNHRQVIAAALAAARHRVEELKLAAPAPS